MKSQRDDTVDILKGIAILAVVGLHIIAHEKPITVNSMLFDQVLRFSVPLFVAMSGYTLAKKYWDKIELGVFFKKRVLRILPLYLVWTIISIYYNESGYPLWEKIFLGRADYHLYFVPMILQLYMLFPLLLFLVKKLAWPTLLVSLIWQVYIYNSYNSTGLSDQQQYILFTSWIFYFVLGMALVRQKIVGLMLAGIGIIWSLVSVMNISVDPIVATRFTRLPVLLYGTGWIVAGDYFRKLKIFTFLGQQSYLIYLAHVLILKLMWGEITNWWPIALGIVVSLGLAFPPKLWAKAWR